RLFFKIYIRKCNWKSDFLNKIKESLFMAKITKNEQENLVENYTKKPAYSNSRLDAHFVCTSNPKLSFDAMTIVGNLNKNSAKKLSDFMSLDPQIRLWDILQTKFKAKALQDPLC
ncbi:TPA: hypothetical protein ACXXJR_002916, partial [Enterococcus faecium]